MAQIGTIKINTASGVKSLPVYDPADARSSVYDMIRVQTPSGTGFVPFTDTSSATYPFLKVQTQNQGVLAAHDKPYHQYTDSFSSFDSSVWTLYGHASYNSSSGRVDMVNSTNQDAELQYDAGMSSTDFTVQWDNIYGGGNYERQYLYFFASDVGTGGDNNKFGGVTHAYAISLNYNGDLILREISNGSATNLHNSSGVAGKSTHTFKMTYTNGTVKCWIDGTQHMNYTISSPNTSYSKLYFKSITGINGSTNSIDNVTLTY